MKSILKEIENLRREYSGAELKEENLDKDPIRQFQAWMEQALASEVPDPHAMTLSTVSPDGKPSARVVLLRGVDDDGFIFFTNYDSRKGTEISKYPGVALVFFWPEVDRQVRVEGEVSRVDAAESDRYFASRPRASQIAAWASNQSAQLSGRGELEKRFAEFESKFFSKPVTRPPNWGGMRVRARSIEFWQGRPGRLHDRIVYRRRDGNSWEIIRLAP